MIMNEKLLEAVRMLQDATKLLDAILVEQIGTHTVVTNQPDYDVSNVDKPKYWRCLTKHGYSKSNPKAPKLSRIYANDYTWGKYNAVVGILAEKYPHEWQSATESEYLSQESSRNLQREIGQPATPYVAPPKFDPNTADKSKMYFAVHSEYGDGVVLFDYILSNWMYESSKKSTTATTCTHIDHEPIERRN